MPPRGYRSVTVRAETYEVLKEEAKRRGISVSRLLDEIVVELRGDGDSGGLQDGELEGQGGLEERLRELEEEVGRLRKVLYDVVVTLDIMRRERSRGMDK